jgi:hypothetical protein
MLVSNNKFPIRLTPTQHPSIDSREILERWLRNHVPEYPASMAAGVSEAIAGVPGLPADLWQTGILARDVGQSLWQKRSYNDVAAENARDAWISPETLDRWGTNGWNDAYGFIYEPKTVDGKLIKDVYSFASPSLLTGIGKSLFRRGANKARDIADSLSGHPSAEVRVKLRRYPLGEDAMDVAKDTFDKGLAPFAVQESLGKAFEDTEYERAARIAGAGVASGASYYRRNVPHYDRGYESWPQKGATGGSALLGGSAANKLWKLRHPPPDSFVERYGAIDERSKSTPWLENYPAQFSPDSRPQSQNSFNDRFDAVYSPEASVGSSNFLPMLLGADGRAPFSFAPPLPKPPQPQWTLPPGVPPWLDSVTEKAQLESALQSRPASFDERFEPVHSPQAMIGGSNFLPMLLGGGALAPFSFTLPPPRWRGE